LLKEMKRSYSRERYLEKIEMARRLVPGLAITTDIIVGFPGETEEDFADTLSLVEEVGYDAAYTFQYSPRPGTAAGIRSDQIPKPGPQARFDRLPAAGKTALSLEVAEALGAEVVSTDSTMGYRGMDIGTDKPSRCEVARVRHHLVDVVPASHTLTVSEFQSMARAAVADILARGR